MAAGGPEGLGAVLAALSRAGAGLVPVRRVSRRGTAGAGRKAFFPETPKTRVLFQPFSGLVRKDRCGADKTVLSGQKTALEHEQPRRATLCFGVK